MDRRDISRGIFAAAVGTALLQKNAIAQTCTAPCYPRTAAETAASVTPANLSYAPLCVDRYGTNATPGTTDMTTAFQHAINVAKIAGGIVTYGQTATYLVTAALDCTFTGGANSASMVIQSLGIQSHDAGYGIIAQHSPKAGHVFDCTGNDAITFRDVTILAPSSSSAPITGIFLARNATAGSLLQRFFNVKVIGYFQVAALYNYGSENDVHIGCYYWNQYAASNTAALVITANNIYSLSSTFTTLPSVVTQSTTEHDLIGCQFQNTAGTSTSDCIHIDAADSIKILGGWGYCGNTNIPAQGRSLIYVDSSYTSSPGSNWLTVHGFTGESTGSSSTEQLYGICLSNNGATHSGWDISASKLLSASTNFALGINGTGSSPTLDNARIRLPPQQLGSGIDFNGTIQNSIVECVGMLVNVGTFKNSTYVGDTSKLTTTARSNVNVLEMGATNRSWSPGIANDVNGWTVSGTITQRGRLNYVGSSAVVNLIVAASTSIACSAGATFLLPVAAADDWVGQIIDFATGAVISGVTVSGNMATAQNAISPTAHTLVLSGIIPMA